MKIHIVNYEERERHEGILTKYANSMEKELLDLDHDVTVSGKPKRSAEINHHINYIAAQKCPTKNTAMVTHFTGDMYNEKAKLDSIRKFLNYGTGICFSKSIKEKLVKNGMPKDKLEVVLPAHDGMIRRPRLIAMAYKIYPDGRKREEMFEKLFKSLKNKKNYIFRIIGPGWQPLLDKMSKDGLQVQWTDQFNLDLYEQLLNTSDYLLYTGGEDAAAQCLIDAKNAGLRSISPKVDEIDVDIPFKTQTELNKIFKDMDKNPVADWTWERYVKNHINIWEKLLK